MHDLPSIGNKHACVAFLAHHAAEEVVEQIAIVQERQAKGMTDLPGHVIQATLKREPGLAMLLYCETSPSTPETSFENFSRLQHRYTAITGLRKLLLFNWPYMAQEDKQNCQTL